MSPQSQVWVAFLFYDIWRSKRQFLLLAKWHRSSSFQNLSQRLASDAYSCGQQRSTVSHPSIFTLFVWWGGLVRIWRKSQKASELHVLLPRRQNRAGRWSECEWKMKLKPNQNKTQKTNMHSTGKNDYKNSQLSTPCIHCWPGYIISQEWDI